MAIPCPTQFIQMDQINRTLNYNVPSNLQSLPLFPSPPQNPRLSSIHLHPNHRKKIQFRHHSYSIPTATKFRIRASPNNSQPQSSSNNRVIIVCSAITLVLAIANRVLYKLALVPMKHYPFFLAQVNTFGYVAIYFSILYMRCHAGIVTDEMMALPKLRFVLIGFLEALGVVAGMSSGAMLPGPAIPILSQTFLLWQLTFSAILLRRRYSWNRIAGCLLVAAGVITAVASGSDSGQMLSGIGFLWPTLMIVSSAFQAGASIIKESIFIDAATRLKGKLLDIFVVNSFGSGFQSPIHLLWTIPLNMIRERLEFAET